MPAGRDGAMRTAVNIAGNDQTVPMHGCGFRKMVGEVDRHGLATPQAQCGAQERAVIAIGRGAPTRQIAYRSRTGTEGNGTVSIRPNFRGDRQGRPSGIPGDGRRKTQRGDCPAGCTGSQRASTRKVDHCCLQYIAAWAMAKVGWQLCGTRQATPWTAAPPVLQP